MYRRIIYWLTGAALSTCATVTGFCASGSGLASRSSFRSTTRRAIHRRTHVLAGDSKSLTPTETV